MAVACVAAALGVVLIIARRHSLGFVFTATACGFWAAWVASSTPAPAQCTAGEEYGYSGRVELSKATAEYYTYHVQIDSVEGSPCTPFTAQIFTAAGGARHGIGSRLQMHARLQPVDAEPDFDVQPTQTAYCAEHGIVAQAFVDGEAINAVGAERSWRSRIDEIHRTVLHRLARCGLTDESFGVLAAMILAENDDLLPEVRDNFRAAGIAHVLALSGFHIGVIVLLLELLLWPLRLWPRLRSVRLLMLIAGVWAFAVLVGLPWSVVRAAIMLSVFVLGKLIGRTTHPLNSLCVAVLVILAVNPMALFAVSMQLSVCAVLGIIALAKVLNPVAPRRRRLFYFMSAVSVSVAALCGTLVPTVAYFHCLPLLFLPANLLMGLLLPAMMIGGMIIAILPSGAAFATAIGACENFLVNLSDGFAAWLKALPGASITDVYLSTGGIVATLLVLGAIVVAVQLNNRRGFIAAGSIAAIAVVLFLITTPKYPENEMVILRSQPRTTLLLRHGDSLVVMPACTAAELDYTVARLSRDLQAYTASRRVASTTITTGNFHLGPYRRTNRLLVLDADTVAMPTGRETFADTTFHVKYLLITPLAKGNADAMAQHISADTLLLSPTLTRRQADRFRRAFSAAAARAL